MNSNEIANPKIEVMSATSLNEKDYLSSLLSILKEMAKNYVISMTEASNKILFKKYFDSFNSVISIQRKTYELMFKNGWYKLEKAKNTKISQKLNTLNQEYIDLNN